MTKIRNIEQFLMLKTKNLIKEKFLKIKPQTKKTWKESIPT